MCLHAATSWLCFKPVELCLDATGVPAARAALRQALPCRPGGVGAAGDGRCVESKNVVTHTCGKSLREPGCTKCCSGATAVQRLAHLLPPGSLLPCVVPPLLLNTYLRHPLQPQRVPHGTHELPPAACSPPLVRRAGEAPALQRLHAAAPTTPFTPGLGPRSAPATPNVLPPPPPPPPSTQQPTAAPAPAPASTTLASCGLPGLDTLPKSVGARPAGRGPPAVAVETTAAVAVASLSLADAPGPGGGDGALDFVSLLQAQMGLAGPEGEPRAQRCVVFCAYWSVQRCCRRRWAWRGWHQTVREQRDNVSTMYSALFMPRRLRVCSSLHAGMRQGQCAG